MYSNNRSQLVSDPRYATTADRGFTNSGRAEVFLTNIPGGGCGEACSTANVAAHEIGHALGLQGRGHFLGISPIEALREWGAGRPRDVMYSGDPTAGPQNYNTDLDRNARILREVNGAKPAF